MKAETLSLPSSLDFAITRYLFPETLNAIGRVFSSGFVSSVAIFSPESFPVAKPF
jgi:hypothetical protein